ncbi:MAG: tRNA (N6-isopentenyl adenosine(37)-C2)-methylthiotransferase MiaB [Candidatus Komeilibacteria bacterium CG11_big_fil_rev_8_21_14_0_20_36_20]|uniref:tRNA-2-methylthio-N(6)-dimethylallyladenosine synthase n=1 Tax=Candidatus Komeilibacteria bacterium CG11_big_fil_rev_8_21_14_0_20_36_20 TaxID=1974477 RepID=A0A2H0NAW4_9BACT|nr:MAG: tRNA (N6-isopentenyl adenosine(37)-C2)-methylthiotransferase MiaB [Candidatus Komeilibacteria bacterium CG11_big_fil_rev_8_21_14_0_20_36_20]PIR82043.1 MAG: tRNA (N6-isopentenyl adenosine(37)-C2)-methylthiotransferase MiaB [Candidatus Komeilibacteria bacterium CG10_big_fil_rev_8_21_14_0_10_36_65]PJC55022.1 MAG: tRNA (N6-isopentenyl adenosine(37)-C2)-methylthiotransferase MiaB [Candidatus Komeilibacteria bacterium CG_4_9_14_0_2_um_filter_36_13]
MTISNGMNKQIKKFYLTIFGCQMNYSDAERLASILKKIGYQETPEESEADLIVTVACSVRQKAVDRIYGKARNWQLIKTKRPLTTILSGCILDKDRRKLTDRFDLFIDIKNLDQLGKKLQELNPNAKLIIPDFFDIEPIYQSNHRAYVPIMTGCNKFCSYCVVPRTRGREKSRPSAKIITEVKNLLHKGFKEIILLGQNVNSYGLDQKKEIRFPELLKKIDGLAENFWLKFSSSHPDDISDDLIKIISKTKNLNDYFHLPVQSGSDTVLKRMNRHYSIKDYQKIIKKIRQVMPGAPISTDIIIGFCGETEKEFQDSIRLVQEIKFNLIYLAQYSERTGTTASRIYTDDIPRNIKEKRWQIINELVGQNSLEFNQSLVNQEREVLIDAVQKNKDNYKNIGRLSNYVTVHILSDQPLKVGQFAKIKVTKAMAWGLQGKVIIK